MVFHRANIKIDNHLVVTMDDVFLMKTESLKYLVVHNYVVVDMKNVIFKVLASCLEQGIMSFKID